MRTRKPMTFETVPSWAVDSEGHSRYTVAAAFELAGFTDKWVRLTAATQREVFGAVLFGKCNVRVNSEGLQADRSVCFGTDFSSLRLGWDDLEQVMASGRRPCF